MKKLLKKIIFGNLYCAVEHSMTEGIPTINYLMLKKQKNEFIIEKEGSTTVISEFNKQTKKDQSIFLIINNEQVITKTLPQQVAPKKAVQSAFPNLNINDFYYETYTTKQSTFVSICRKEYVDGIIKEYDAVSLPIINFSLGSLISTQILSYTKETNIRISNSTLLIKNNEFIKIEKTDTPTDETYTINGLDVKGSSINCLSGILCYYTDISKTEWSFGILKNKLRDNFIQKEIFNLGLRTALAFIFVVLLSNFLIFNNYGDKINDLSNEVEIGQNNEVNLLAVKKEVEKKEKIINEISMVEGSKLSLYFDIIGATIPKTMQLNQLNYQPLTKKMKNEKEIEYIEKTIIVKGVSIKSEGFSNWITNLEKEKWIKSILVVSYGVGKQKSSEFEIKIILKN